MSLSKIGSSPGYWGAAATTQNIVFTHDSGVFHYGDLLVYGWFTAAVSITGLSASDFIGIHEVTALEAGSSTVTIAHAVGSGSDIIFAPGVAVRGGTTALAIHGTLATALNGNNLDDFRTASGASPRSALLAAHATGLSPTGTQELLTYTMAAVDEGIGGGTSYTVAAGTAGIDLGLFQYSPFGSAIRSAYTLSAPTTEVAYSYAASWAGGGNHRAYTARKTFLIHLDQGGPTAVLVMTGGTPSLDVTADFSGSTDPDQGLNDTVYCTVDWGDGNTSGPVLYSTNTLPHTYAAPGVYTVTLTAEDLYGNSDTDTADILVGTVDEEGGNLGTEEWWDVLIGTGVGGDTEAIGHHTTHEDHGGDRVLGAWDYEFEQASASATWVIAHALGGRPQVTIVDDTGLEVQAQVVYDSDDQVTVSFSVAQTGKAYLT